MSLATTGIMGLCGVGVAVYAVTGDKGAAVKSTHYVGNTGGTGVGAGLGAVPDAVKSLVDTFKLGNPTTGTAPVVPPAAGAASNKG